MASTQISTDSSKLDLRWAVEYNFLTCLVGLNQSFHNFTAELKSAWKGKAMLEVLELKKKSA